MRLLLGLAGVVLLAGCGSATTGSGKPADAGAPVAPAPPIVALDEAPPEPVARTLELEFAPPSNGASGTDAVQTTFTWTDGATSTSASTPPTPAQLAAARAQLDEHRRQIEPGPGSAPRVVARLPLDGGGEALFVAWHNDAGELCTLTSTTDAQGSGGGGLGGPCQASDSPDACAAICLTSGGTGGPGHERYLLSGTVSADADAIDVTTADGATAEYPLAGPLVDGDRRVFLLDLGAQDWRKLALVRGGDVSAETAMPAAEVAGEECRQKAGPMPPVSSAPSSGPPTGPPPALRAWENAFQACLQASGSTP